MSRSKNKTFDYEVIYQDTDVSGKVVISDITPKSAAIHVARSLGYQCRQPGQNATYSYVYDLDKINPPKMKGLKLQVINRYTGRAKSYCITD